MPSARGHDHDDCGEFAPALGNAGDDDGGPVDRRAGRRLLNITEHFVRRLIGERRIPFLKVGRLVRLRSTDLEDYLAACAVPAARR